LTTVPNKSERRRRFFPCRWRAWAEPADRPSGSPRWRGGSRCPGSSAEHVPARGSREREAGNRQDLRRARRSHGAKVRLARGMHRLPFRDPSCNRARRFQVHSCCTRT